MQYSKDSPNAFRRLRRRGIPPAKIRKGGGAAPLKTAKEPGEKHWLEPHFTKPPIDFFAQSSIRISRRAKRGEPKPLAISYVVRREGFEPP